MTRGLDVDDIKFVINYDYPSNSEDYIHRIGRTGRKGNTGTSYTLFTSRDAAKAQVCLFLSQCCLNPLSRIFQDLISVLTEAKQHVSQQLRELAEGRGARGGYGYGRF